MHIFDPIAREFLIFEYLDGQFFIWYKYSLMILIGMVLAALFGIREGNKLGLKTDTIIDGILIIVPLSIIGTRLWYVIFEWEYYAWDFIKIISISDGGLAIHGGFITAFISVYFFAKYKKINLLSAFDIVAPGFLVAQSSGRWGNFFNQEAHGGMIGGVDDNNIPLLSLDQQREFLSETLHLPDFITNNMLMAEGEGYLVDQAAESSQVLAAYYHPTFLYESIWNITGFIIMLIIRRTKWLRNGDLLAFYLIWYSVGRFFIEGMRTDSLYIGNTELRTAQIISVIMVLFAGLYLYITHKVMKVKRYHEVLEDNADNYVMPKWETAVRKLISKLVAKVTKKNV